MKDVRYSKDAEKSLRRMPSNTAALIRSKITQYAENPETLTNNVKALQGAGLYFRLRVGDWRVVFSEDAVVVAIIRIAPRGGAYD